MEEGKREVHYTYLDTVGRPVIVARKTNLVEQHIQDFEVRLVLCNHEFCVPLNVQWNASIANAHINLLITFIVH